MINGVTMKICVDDYILRTLKEDINDEDVSTNAVMPVNKQGSAQLICKDDGVICGLDVFFRTFRLLDDTARFDCAVQDTGCKRVSCWAPCTVIFRPFSPASARR